MSIDDAFSELSVSGPPPPPPEPFRAGEQVLYTDSQGRNFPAEVVKVRHKRSREACDKGRHTETQEKKGGMLAMREDTQDIR